MDFCWNYFKIVGYFKLNEIFNLETNLKWKKLGFLIIWLITLKERSVEEESNFMKKMSFCVCKNIWNFDVEKFFVHFVKYSEITDSQGDNKTYDNYLKLWLSDLIVPSIRPNFWATLKYDKKNIFQTEMVFVFFFIWLMYFHFILFLNNYT